jgi:peptide/nickel transport system permease protein
VTSSVQARGTAPVPVTPAPSPRRPSRLWPILLFALRRLLLAVPMLLLLTILAFVLISLIPGDVALAILGENPPPEVYRQLRTELGLDESLVAQYWQWLQAALHGDFGSSLFSGQPVTDAISSRLPVTLSLLLGGLLVSLVLGVALGVLSAVVGGPVARVVDAVALLGFAIPGFWFGAQLVVVFAVELQLFPPTGYVPLEDSPVEWAGSLVLPVAALALAGIANLAKQTREAMLDVMGSEYINAAWANGVSARSVILRHSLKNASLRVVTILGLQAVSLLGGTVIIENVFALPGMGTLAASATSRSDIPMIQGILVYYTLMVIVVNLVIDLSYSWLNPRVGAPS